VKVLKANIVIRNLFISAHCLCEIASSPEVLPNIVLLPTSVHPRHMDRTLSVDKANHFRHRIFWRNRYHHMHMIWHQMSLLYQTLFLPRQTKYLQEYFSYLTTQLRLIRTVRFNHRTSGMGRRLPTRILLLNVRLQYFPEVDIETFQVRYVALSRC
jgi:hypothetical protein